MVGTKNPLRKSFAGLTWMLPAIILVFFVTFYPLFYSFFVSLHQTSYLKIIDYVAFKNYTLFFRDSSTLNSITASLTFVFSSVFVSVFFGFVLAMLLNQDIVFRGLIRTIIMAPWIMAQIITAIIWNWFLNPSLSPLSYIAQELGFGKIRFLTHPTLAMVSIIVASIWRYFPLPMLLILAALQTIPNELYEAGKVDGVSLLQSVFYITLPLLKRSIATIMILSTLFFFNKITLPLVLTGGGPGEATNLLTILLYRTAFEAWRIGYASAISTVIFLINLIVSIGYLKVLRTESY